MTICVFYARPRPLDKNISFDYPPCLAKVVTPPDDCCDYVRKNNRMQQLHRTDQALGMFNFSRGQLFSAHYLIEVELQ